MKTYIIPRDVLDKMLNNPRARDAFERFQSSFSVVEDATVETVAATTRLQDAAFVTLSANAELPNERVLEFGAGIGAAITDTTVRIYVTDNVPQVDGGFRVRFVTSGDTMLGLPPSGTLANEAWVQSQVSSLGAGLVDYADDAAAAAGGIAVGKLYRTGSQIKVRIA